MKRTLALLFCVALIVTLATSMITVPATAQGIEATEEDTILISFTDFQDKSGVNSGKQTLQKLVKTLEDHGMKKADGLFMVGDLNVSGSYYDQSSISLNVQSMQAISDVFSPLVGDNILYTQGNHDLAATPGLCPAGNNDPATGEYGVFVIHEDQYGEWGNTPNETKQAAADLKAYLDAKVSSGWTKPIFILNHIPLHWGNRTLADGSGSQGYQLFDVLNEAGGRGLNIIYLFGHNHSSGYDDFLGSSAIYLKKGDKIEIAQGTKYEVKTETLNFTYMNSGYVGYNSSKDTTADTGLTLSVFLIRGDEVIITRYDVNGIHNLKSAGVWNSSFSEEGYHATPNPVVYASSRKVSATADVEVDPPYYSKKEAATTTSAAATTTRKSVATTTTRTLTSESVYKPTVTQKTESTVSTTVLVTPTTTGKPVDIITTTLAVADPIGTGTPSTEAPSVTATLVTDPSRTVIEHDCVMPDEDGEKDREEDTAKPEKGFPLGLVLGIGGGAVLLIGAVVVWVLLKRKKS